MLGASEDLIGRAVISTLKTTHARRSKRSTQKRIFTGAFADASPTRIASDIKHRRKRPAYAVIICLLRGHGSRSLSHHRIPTTRFAERDRKDRAVTVNGVEPKQQRNLQARLVYCNALTLVCSLYAANVQRRSEQALARETDMLGTKGSIASAAPALRLPPLQPTD